ncbi:MAG: hypothetical protein AB1635_08050 [Acidobacteriota bacterium]
MADVAMVRNRLRMAIEAARRDAAERRRRADEAARAYEAFVARVATPAFRAMATVLKAEGIPFEVMSPAGGVRLAPARSRDQGIELALDTSVDPPRPTITTTVRRGSHGTARERPVKGDVPIDELTEDDVIEMLLEELGPWLA